MATRSDNLTVKQAKFAEVWVKTGNATEAYRQAYNVANMSDETIGRTAHALTKHRKIDAIYKKATEGSVQAAVMDRMEVMRHLVQIAEADPSRVVTHRRICCRHCYGIGHAYQWRDPEEYYETLAKAMDDHARATQRAAKAGDPAPAVELPTDAGGYGWRKPNKPHPDCPRCYGEGFGDVFIRDMDDLTGPERRLIAGIKQTKEGIEIKMRDQDGALNTIAQVLKMLVQRSEVSGPDGGPVPMAVLNAVMPLDPTQASQLYQKIMEGK